jgi:hypothetical protein
MKLMLKRFEVENFRGFSGKWVFNLEAGQYGFTQSVVYNGLVKNALIYGYNGAGKTTLGVAMFDIVSHLTDNQAIPSFMLMPYCNLQSGASEAVFKFVFKRGEGELVYSYAKDQSRNLLRETLDVDGREIVNWNYGPSGRNFVERESIGDLQINLPDDKLSVVKYIARNTPTGTVPAVSELMDFVTHMLWFRNLDTRNYAGMQPGENNIVKTMHDHSALPKLERFLKEHGLDYKLAFHDDNGRMYIAAKYDNGKTADLFSIASSGTISLILYFAWSIMAFDSASLVFIDEFDAFLHFTSSTAIVRDLIAHPNFQSIITTHNVSLLSNAITRPDCCYVIGKTKIASFAENSDRVIREAHNLEKMYVNGLFAES